MFDDVEGAFRRLDAKPFFPFAKELAAYRTALMQEGFTRREAMRILECYSDYICDEMTLDKVFNKISELRDQDDDGDDLV